MSSITTDVAEQLSNVHRPTDFVVTGVEQMLAPGLEVDGIGPIGLPLPSAQAEQLIALAERAPYGRGEATVTDITVRRTWQIGADRVRLRSKYWPKTLDTILSRVAEGLGISDRIDADLYKLLIYDEGSFFLPHRDTEKAPGMFATLILALPSVSQGGELVVRHGDREVRLDLACDEPSDLAFAAFYADCVHEVLPVHVGHRLVLVYNLVRGGQGALPEAPSYDNEVSALSQRLKRWVEAPRTTGKAHGEPDAEDAGHTEDRRDGGEPDDEPSKLIYPLGHAYTPAELGFRALKGADAGIAQVVVAAAGLAGCEVHLALVSIEESGSAVPTDNYRGYRRSRYDDDEDDDDDDDEAEFEAVEMSDRKAVASNWRRMDGEPSALTEIPVLEAEFSPPLSFDELDPDEEHFHEATGNEGATYERTYSRAALILWPRDRLLAVVSQGGVKVTLPYLEDLVKRWAVTGDDAIKQQAHELAELMLTNWKPSKYTRHASGERSSVGQFLNLLVRLDDSQRLERFLAVITAYGGFGNGDCQDMADALHVLSRDRSAVLANDLIASAAEAAFAACAGLLARVAARDASVATRAAQTLVGALPGDRSRGLSSSTLWYQPSVQPAFIVDLLTALVCIDAALAAEAMDKVLASSATYDFDTILLPAVHALLEIPANAQQPVVVRLRDACLKHLNARITLALEPPRDWRRDSKLSCNCDDCQALGRYLEDAEKREWVFAAAQHRRSHLEEVIRWSRCDVDFRTEKRGSPHRLVCTKNHASYQQRCVQRESDLKQRDRLTG